MKKSARDYLFVSIQLLLFCCFIFNPGILKIHFPGLLTGFGFFLIGLGIVIVAVAMLQLQSNLSPFPSPVAGGTLVQSGLYKNIRHPIYLGVLLMGLGISLATDSGFRLILTALLFVLFYFKSRYEEKLLAKQFPDYDDYMTKTGRFISLW